MDKFRAIEYFVCAARDGSLTAAAHRLDVSVAAVSKLLTGLERELGARLFERSPGGVVLTAEGREFLGACEPALVRIRDAEALVGHSRSQASGAVSIAVQAALMTRCLAATLAELHARHPQIQLDFRDYLRGGDVDTESADLRLTTAWDERPDEVARVLCRTRLVVCASPAYWARQGLPRAPQELDRHNCLLVRAPRGTVMDQWPFERQGEKVSIAVRGWLTAGNAGIEAAVSAAVAGEGVIRSLDVLLESELQSGRLVPALLDWHVPESPAVRLRYRPAASRPARIRSVIDFLTATFHAIEQRCTALTGPRAPGTPPAWAGSRAFRHASTAPQRR